MFQTALFLSIYSLLSSPLEKKRRDFILEFPNPQWESWVENHNQTRSYLTLQRHNPQLFKYSGFITIMFSENAGNSCNWGFPILPQKDTQRESDSSFGRDNRPWYLCVYLSLTPCPSCWTRHMRGPAFSTATGQTSNQQAQNKHHMSKQSLSKCREIEGKHSCTGIQGLWLSWTLL